MVGAIDRGGVLTEDELWQRMAGGLVEASRHFAAAATGAFVVDEPGVAIDVFPNPPDRAIYNNALFDRGLDSTARRSAIAAMEVTYAGAGVDGYAAWAHESDTALIDDLLARGYRLSESTRAMAMRLDELDAPRRELDATRIDWPEHVRLIEAPDGLLARLDERRFHIYAARLDGRPVATAIAFDHEGDCGIYNVGTLPEARRQGIATALTTHLLHQAKARGCATASLQSTPMAESVYASVGFGSLGLIHEYVPGAAPR